MCVTGEDCGTCKILTRANARRVHNGARVVAWTAVAVFLLGGGAVVIIHWLKIALMCIGALVLAAVAVWVWWRQHAGTFIARPRLQQPVMQVPQFRARQPVAQPQQQALPAAQIHYHYGDQLSLPSVTDDGLERILNRRGER